MIVSSASPAPRTPSAYCRWRSSRSVLSSSPVSPMTPFIGVRISWLIVARNADFAREAVEGGVAGRLELDAGRGAPDRSSRAVRTIASASDEHHPDDQLDRVVLAWPRRSAISSSTGGTRSGHDRDARAGRRIARGSAVDLDAARSGTAPAPPGGRGPSGRAEHPADVRGARGLPVVVEDEVAEVGGEPAADADPEPRRRGRPRLGTHRARGAPGRAATASATGYAAQTARTNGDTEVSATMSRTERLQSTSTLTTTTVSASITASTSTAPRRRGSAPARSTERRAERRSSSRTRRCRRRRRWGRTRPEDDVPEHVAERGRR